MGLLQDFTDKPFKTNPVFVLVLGLCPTLAVSTTVANAFWMAVAVTIVLIGSNVIIASIKSFVPKDVRIPCFIVVIASFVSMVDIAMAGTMPVMHKTLGIFIPLIVVNCIIIGRAEAFASRRSVPASVMDALGIGAGYMMSILLIAAIREIVGTGQLTLPLPLNSMSADLDPTGFLFTLNNESSLLRPMQIFTLAPGAFLVIGLLFGLMRMRKARKLRRERAGRGYLVPQVASDFPKKAPAAATPAAPPAGDAPAPGGPTPAQEGA
jgi:electron transport complex protein RnfE